MIAVIFEVWPAPSEGDHYLAIAADLLPHLKQIDGFLSIERFESLSEPGKMLSLSFWRDEAAIAQWRQLELHRTAQRQGRNGIFQDYRLRICATIRDYGMRDREQAPPDSQQIHPPLPTGSAA